MRFAAKWNEDDHDVPADGAVVGRIFKVHAAPVGTPWMWTLGSILYVEASHLALSKTENVSDRLVFKPVRLPLERFAFEIADGLPDFCDDRAIRSSMKAHRFDVRTDHGPLARPVLAYCFASMNVATIHTVGPGDIIGEHGQHAVNVPCVKAIVDALEEFDITIHWFSPWHDARVASEAMIANLDQVASVEMTLSMPISETGS
jgi:hypothetical protein